MTAFLELVNDNGVSIVDETYPCLALRQWGTGWALGQPSFAFPAGGVHVQDITYAGGTAPVLALFKAGMSSRLDRGVGVLGRSYNAQTNTWTFRVMVICNPTFGEDYSFTYYIFDEPLPLPSGAVGAELMNSAGRCVFSSGQHQMLTKAPATTLPTGKWAHTFRADVKVQNDTYETSETNGDITYHDRYTITLGAWGCDPNRVYFMTRSYSQVRKQTGPIRDIDIAWTPAGLEANTSDGSFLIDVSRIL